MPQNLGLLISLQGNEYDCMDKIKKLLSYLPQNNLQEPHS